MGYKSWKEYVANLPWPTKPSRSWTSRLRSVYKLSLSPTAPSKNILLQIGIAKLSLLVAKANRAGDVDIAMFDKASRLNLIDLKRELGYKLPSYDSSEQYSQDYDHLDLQQKIKDIGEAFKLQVQMEYPESEYEYDVVWRNSTQLRSATHVFEVQVKGSLEEALTKLKLAYDNMGKPILCLVVATAKDMNKAEALLKGAFKEMADELVILRPVDIYQLHRSLIAAKSVMSKLGLPSA